MRRKFGNRVEVERRMNLVTTKGLGQKQAKDACRVQIAQQCLRDAAAGFDLLSRSLNGATKLMGTCDRAAELFGTCVDGPASRKS